MAEQKEQVQQEGKKKFPIKTLIIMLVVLIIEGAAISAAFLLSGGPEEVKADGAAEDEAAMMEQPVEVLVVSDKFQNTRSGRSFLYDTEVYIVIRGKHQDYIDRAIENMRAQISTEIATIFRRAEPSHLLEPELSTLTRQIRAALDKRFGHDDEGEPYVQEVLIRKCTQYRADM